jgi:hypothetical protein
MDMSDLHVTVVDQYPDLDGSNLESILFSPPFLNCFLNCYRR